MENHVRTAFFAAAVWLCCSGGAFAEKENKSADVTIQLDIKAGCNLNFDGDSAQLSFGTFIDLKERRTARGTFSLRCTQTDDNAGDKKVKISLDGGTKQAADKPQARFLYSEDGKSSMSFQVYQKDSGTEIWGEGTNAYTVTIPAAANEQMRIPFYAELFAQNLDNNPEGLYSNVLRATVDYNH